MAGLQEELHDKGEEWKFTVTYSYLEIYNEKVLDLLKPTQTDLPIREDHRKKIFVVGLSYKEINNVQEFNESFGPASKNRYIYAHIPDKADRVSVSRDENVLLFNKFVPTITKTKCSGF